MKKLILAIVLIFSSAAFVYAQSTATPVQMGVLTSSGCPGSSFTCFLPYSSSNPLPVSLAIIP